MLLGGECSSSTDGDSDGWNSYNNQYKCYKFLTFMNLVTSNYFRVTLMQTKQ